MVYMYLEVHRTQYLLVSITLFIVPLIGVTYIGNPKHKQGRILS